jgi:hypothetical protein
MKTFAQQRLKSARRELFERAAAPVSTGRIYSELQTVSARHLYRLALG